MVMGIYAIWGHVVVVIIVPLVESRDPGWFGREQKHRDVCRPAMYPLDVASLGSKTAASRYCSEQNLVLSAYPGSCDISSPYLTSLLFRLEGHE